MTNILNLFIFIFYLVLYIFFVQPIPLDAPNKGAGLSSTLTSTNGQGLHSTYKLATKTNYEAPTGSDNRKKGSCRSLSQNSMKLGGDSKTSVEISHLTPELLTKLPAVLSPDNKSIPKPKINPNPNPKPSSKPIRGLASKTKESGIRNGNKDVVPTNDNEEVGITAFGDIDSKSNISAPARVPAPAPAPAPAPTPARVSFNALEPKPGLDDKVDLLSKNSTCPKDLSIKSLSLNAIQGTKDYTKATRLNINCPKPEFIVSAEVTSLSDIFIAVTDSEGLNSRFGYMEVRFGYASGTNYVRGVAATRKLKDFVIVPNTQAITKRNPSSKKLEIKYLNDTILASSNGTTIGSSRVNKFSPKVLHLIPQHGSATLINILIKCIC